MVTGITRTPCVPTKATDVIKIPTPALTCAQKVLMKANGYMRVPCAMLVEPMDKNRAGYPGKQISGKLLKVLHLWVEHRPQVQAGRQQM